MRLATKLVLLFLVALLLIVGVFAKLTIEQQQQLAIIEHERYAADLAAAMEPMLRRAFAEEGGSASSPQVRRTTQQLRHVRIRLIDMKPGAEGSERFSPVIVAEQSVTTTTQLDRAGRPVRVAYVPMHQGDREVCKLEVTAPSEAFGERLMGAMQHSLLALISVSLLSGVVILLGGLVMVGRPLDRLIEKVHRVSRGDLSGPVVVRARDELGRLAIALNAMCASLKQQRETIEKETSARIAAVQQLRHSDRLGSVGRMAAGVAHEIGTPLGVVSGRAELIASGRLDETQVRQSAVAIKEESQRIAQIVRQLLDFARHSAPQRVPGDLTRVVAQTLELVRPLAKKRGGTLHCAGDERSHPATFDPSQIQQVLTNLVVNAVQSAEGVAVTVQLDRRRAIPPPDVGTDPVDCQLIEIADNGPGIAESDLEHIFEPFFTTKDVGEGTGLGLSISYGIVREHGGWIEVDSQLGRGSTFVIYLPVDAASKEE